jgi:hypothetical protein
MCLLGACAGTSRPGASTRPLASAAASASAPGSTGVSSFRTVPVAAPPVLARLGIGEGQGLLSAGWPDWPLWPMSPLGGEGIVIGLPVPGTRPYTGRNRFAGYAVADLSDGRVSRLPVEHPSWKRATVDLVMATTTDRVIWLESGQQPAGYVWALYSSAGPGAPPVLLDESSRPVPGWGVPVAAGVSGNDACWAYSSDDRSWTVIRQPVTGDGLRVSARVDDMVGSCAIAGSDTLAATQQGPHDPPMHAGERLPGNVFDIGPTGHVREILPGAHTVAALGDQVAFTSEDAAPAGRVSVARLTAHGLAGIHAVGPRDVSDFAWLDATHLVILNGAMPSPPAALYLVNTRTGQTGTIAAPRGGVTGMTAEDGRLVYSWQRPPAGPGQVLEIDEFTLPH